MGILLSMEFINQIHDALIGAKIRHDEVLKQQKLKEEAKQKALELRAENIIKEIPALLKSDNSPNVRILSCNDDEFRRGIEVPNGNIQLLQGVGKLVYNKLRDIELPVTTQKAYDKSSETQIHYLVIPVY